MPTKSTASIHLLHNDQDGPESAVSTETCFLIQPDRNRDATNRLISKLGGAPYLLADEGWPICKKCNDPLTFIGQFRRKDVPLWHAREQNLLRFFYCFRCQPWWDPEGASSHLSWTSISAGADLLAEKHIPISQPNAPKEAALRFRKKLDHPVLQTLSEFKDREQWEVDSMSDRYRNEPRSKFGGFPSWQNIDATPNDPDSGKPMDFLGQFGASESLGLDWGDDGRLFLFESQSQTGATRPVILIQYD